MPAEHIRPNGLAQGYFCYTCGQSCNMVGTGHGEGKCVPNPNLVKTLTYLNRGDKNMPTETLGQKLAATLDELEQAIRHGQLPFTEGFFFGKPADNAYYEEDLKFCLNAKAELFLGLSVFYNSSW